MGLSDDSDEQRFEELCLDLNMDKNAKDEAAQAFERMRRNYTLEVKSDRFHLPGGHVCFEISVIWRKLLQVTFVLIGVIIATLSAVTACMLCVSHIKRSICWKRVVTLQGNTLHWLACALYVSGRRNVPTVEGRVAPGNYVSLTRLLRSGKLRYVLEVRTINAAGLLQPNLTMEKCNFRRWTSHCHWHSFWFI